MQFYVCAWTEAGEGDWSDILAIVSIDYCNEDLEDCEWDSFFEDEEFTEYPYGWIGDGISETNYHLAWDAPYDPYGFYGEPVGYIVYADNFGDWDWEYRPVARVDGSQEWENSWSFDITDDPIVGACTTAPRDAYDIMEPPSFDELVEMASTLGVTLTQAAYDLLMSVDDPMAADQQTMGQIMQELNLDS